MRKEESLDQVKITDHFEVAGEEPLFSEHTCEQRSCHLLLEIFAKWIIRMSELIIRVSSSS